MMRFIRISARAPLTVFAGLVYFASLIFYLVVPSTASSVTGARLPAAALMFVCPGLAALLLVIDEKGRAGARRWLAGAFGRARVVWLVPAVLLPSVVVGVSELALCLSSRRWPHPSVGWLTIPLLFLVYLVAAAGEELGWSAYVVPRLQRHRTALESALIIGVVWAAWHIVAYRQLGHGASWIAWQCLFTVALRVVLVWLYDNAGGNATAPAVAHASYNLAWSLLPGAGSSYNPVASALIMGSVAILLALFWGTRTLAERPRERLLAFRFRKSKSAMLDHRPGP